MASHAPGGRSGRMLIGISLLILLICVSYTSAVIDEHTAEVKFLSEMGFSIQAAIRALRNSHGNLDKALNALLQHESQAGLLEYQSIDSSLEKNALRKPQNYERLMELVQMTQHHPRFQQDYSFLDPAFADSDGWVETKECGKGSENLSPLVGIDCEMCVTANKYTGEDIDKKTLIQATVVDGEPRYGILANLMVRPGRDRTVLDAKDEIHGITKEQILRGDNTFKEAQQKVLSLICEDTIIIGHSLASDLKALKIKHRNIIDTAYVFKLRGSKGSPGLKDVAKALLNEWNDENAHDPAYDAQMSAKVAQYEARHGPSGPVSRANAPDKKSQIFVHNILKSSHVNEEAISDYFRRNTRVSPIQVQNIKWRIDREGTAKGTTTVTFASKADATRAFNALNARKQRTDAAGRPEKEIAALLKGQKKPTTMRMCKLA